MIIQNLFTIELKNFCKSYALPQFLFMLFMLLFMEFGMNITDRGIISLGSLNIIFYVIICQSINSSLMSRSSLQNSLEYYLSRTVTRKEIFIGKMTYALFLCSIIIVTVGAISVIKEKQVIFRVYGLENSEKLKDSGNFTIVPDDSTDYMNRKRLELLDLIKQGKLDEFKEKERTYSVPLESAHGLFYMLFVKLFLVFWTVISSSIYIKIGDVSSPAEVFGKYLSEPWAYFKGSGMILTFCFILLPFLSTDGILRGGSYQLAWYLLNFWTIAIVSFISIVGAWLIVRKSYLKAEV